MLKTADNKKAGWWA